MKISASIYSYKQKDLLSLLKELEAYQVDSLHIDCIDNPDVFKDIELIRKNTGIPLELHLISPNPEKYFELIALHRIEKVVFQHENLDRKLEIPSFIQSQIGIAIISKTNLDVLKQYKKIASFFMLMTTTPGKSGEKFNKHNFKRIRQLRNRSPNNQIHVDGGINEEVTFILRNLGVYSVVVGSYLFKNSYIGSAFIHLKSDDVKSHIRAKDFMLEIDEIPLLEEDRFNFHQLLHVIEDYKMGLAIITDKKGKMNGLITNADVRRGLLAHIDDLNKIPVNSIINRNPAYISENDTITNILTHIKKLSFPIQFIPVVDVNKKLTGLLRFNNLIKGES